jgi:uncharacterized protein YciI
MFFVIRTIQAKGAIVPHATATPAHQAYLALHRLRILAAGSLLGNNGSPIGSMCIIEADNLLAATQFVEGDPMTASGTHELIDVVEWQMTGYNQEYPLPI